MEMNRKEYNYSLIWTLTFFFIAILNIQYPYIQDLVILIIFFTIFVLALKRLYYLKYRLGFIVLLLVPPFTFILLLFLMFPKDKNKDI